MTDLPGVEASEMRYLGPLPAAERHVGSLPAKVDESGPRPVDHPFGNAGAVSCGEWLPVGE